MKTNRSLIISHLDKRLKKYPKYKVGEKLHKGWINAIRTSLNMSQQQLANKLSKTRQSIHQLEQNERNEVITIKSLRMAAEAMGMDLVYALVPKEQSIKKTIQNRAREKAIEIVRRTNSTMALEDQDVSKKRLKNEIEELTKEILDEMPKWLWD